VKFSFGQRVYVAEIETWGRVMGIHIDACGTRYDVRYFVNGETKSAYLFEDELQETKP